MLPTPGAKVQVAIFDAYGTLLDVNSAMQRHAGRLGPDWQRISEEWRSKQMEYTWVRSLAGPAQHEDFARLTDAALEFVAAKHGITDRALLADVAKAYRALDTYSEVPGMLKALRGKGISRAILSNGEPAMLAEGVRAAGLEGLLDEVLSVEPVGVFKPHPRVYHLATRRFGLPPAEMAFFSSNAWDAFGAHAFGFRVFWVNRKGQPEEYGLGGKVRILPDLAGVPDLLAPLAATA